MSEEEEDEHKELSEEQEEQEEEENNDNDNKNITNNSNKEEKKTHSYYLSIISNLESEIELEKNKIMPKVEKTKLDEQYELLQNELNKKEEMLKKLQSTNKKQKKALDSLTNRLNEENNKNKENKLIDKEEKAFKSNERKKIKWEENKELDNATKIMKELRMENISLVKLLFENKDYTDNINLGNLNKEMKEQLEKKIEEKRLLTEQLKSHLECKEEQKKLKEEMKTLINQLKDIKSKTQDKKEKIEELELKLNKNYVPYFSLDNFTLINKINQNKNQNKKSIKLNISTPNIHKNKINYKNPDNKKLKLPLILPKEELILTEEFYKKIKKIFNNNEKEYNNLIQKIKSLETKKKKTENRNRNEINEKISRLNSLDEKYKIMNLDEKYSVYNSHILKNKLNVFVTNNQKILRKLKELKKELQNKKNISQKKNGEISQLQNQIKNIKELSGLCKINVEDNNIKKYIEEIKNGKRIKETKKEKSKEETKNDNKLITKVTKDEESIQTDSFYDKNNNIGKKNKKK